MDKKTLTIVLSVVLIGCFFLGYLGPVSGFDIVKMPFGWEKYVLLLIPISGLLLLIGAINNGNYFLSRSLLCWLPLLAVLFWIIGMPLIEGAAIGDVFKGIGDTTGIGLWIALAASIVLAFYNPPAK